MDFFGTGRSLHAAIQTTATVLDEATNAETCHVKEAQQRKHRPFGKEDVPKESSFLDASWDATRGGDLPPSGLCQYRRRWHAKVPRDSWFYPVGGKGRVNSRPLGYEYQEKLGTKPHLKVFVVCAAPHAAFPRRVFAPSDAVRYPVHPIRCLLIDDQVRAGSNTRPVLVRVVNIAQPAEILPLPLLPDVLQVPAASVDLTTRSVAATSRPRLFLVLFSSSLPGWCLGSDSTADGSSAKPSGIKEGPLLGNNLSNGD